MKQTMKRTMSMVLAFSTALAFQVPVMASSQSIDFFQGVNKDAPAISDFSGIGIDISMPKEAADPNDAKPSVVSGDFTYKVQDDGTAIITDYSGKGGDVTVPAMLGKVTVTKLGDAALQQCNIRSIKLPDSLKTLGAASLSANNLTSITLPQNLTYVDMGTFTGNSQLKTVTVLSSNTTFGFGCFQFCPSDITVYAPKGSAAEVYAIDKNQKLKFVAKPATQALSDPAAPASFVAAQVPMKHVTAVKRDVKCTWAAVKGAAGYEVYHAEYGPFTLAGSTTNGLSYTIPGLNTGVYHYYKVRAYKMVNGKKVYGNFSPTQYTMVTDPYLDK